MIQSQRYRGMASINSQDDCPGERGIEYIRVEKGDGNAMAFMDKELEELVVTLPFADGTELDCGVFASFEVNGKTYLALLPLKGEKQLDFSHSYMIYRVEEDQEHNPVVAYIENDLEYAIVARYFSEQYLNKQN